MLGKCCTPVQISWTETDDCNCPVRRISAPVLDFARTADTRLKTTKLQDLKDSKSKDDKADEKNAADSESADRFDTQNLLNVGVSSGTACFNERTNTQPTGTWILKGSFCGKEYFALNGPTRDLWSHAMVSFIPICVLYSEPHSVFILNSLLQLTHKCVCFQFSHITMPQNLEFHGKKPVE